MTEAEKKLWFGFLRHEPVRWLKQRPIARFIPDLYCSAHKLIVELDGSQHYTPDGLARDAEHTAVLESLGLRVVRFTNQEVLTNFNAVCLQIKASYGPNLRTRTPTPQTPS